MATSGNTKITAVIAIFAIVITGVLLGAWLTGKSAKKNADIPELLPESRPLTTFTLTTHKKSPLNLKSLSGKWSFLFFGYTNCPDVCPTTLAELNGTYTQLLSDKMKDDASMLDDTQFIFVSVDPERDTPKFLADYIGYFNEEFIGATGTKEQLTNITTQFGIKHSRGDEAPDGYLVNHSSAVMLVNPQTQYYARFKAPHYSEVVKKQYLSIRKYYSSTQNTPQ